MNSSVESISTELKLRKKKGLVNFSYNANNNNICDHLRNFGKSLDTLLTMTNYDKVFLMEDLNAEEADIHVKLKKLIQRVFNVFSKSGQFQDY